MADILSIGSSAINSYQRALSTVSNNIANLDTEGYTRQEISLKESTPQSQGQAFFGTGSQFDSIKRAYSAFAESGLRSSYSELNTQVPLTTYANRVIDIMGSEQSGLTPAIDKFFASARALSATPASADMRGEFLRSADGLASRFRELSSQLNAVDTGTRDEINTNLQNLSAMASQLAIVNGQLARKRDVTQQPPDLLDQRDHLLVQMSKIAGLQVSTLSNGVVSVGLGKTIGEGLIVDGNIAKNVSASFNETDAGKVEVVVDPYGKATTVTGLTNGSVAGLIAFRLQALETTSSALDYLAQTAVKAVNDVHRLGIDANGEQGHDLFAIDPSFRVDTGLGAPVVNVGVSVTDISKTAMHDIELRYDQSRTLWTAKDLTTGGIYKGNASGDSIDVNGLHVTITGRPRDAESVILRATSRPSAGVRLIENDPLKIAAGALFRVTENANNRSAATATVSLEPPPAINGNPPPGPMRIDDVLVNNSNAAAAVNSVVNPSTHINAVATIPAGYDNIQLLMNSPDSGLDVQVFTRDGRHVLGMPINADQQKLLLQPGNGFAPGSSYSADYLNAAADKSYLKLDMFYGARAVAYTQTDSAGNPVPNAPVGTARLEATNPPTYSGVTAGAITINGQSLGTLTEPSNGLSTQNVVDWINRASALSGVVASSMNTITIPANALRLKDQYATLSINGTVISAPGSNGFTNNDSLLTAINRVSQTTHVSASIAGDGALTLSNITGYESNNIVIDKPNSKSALSLDAGYTSHARLILSSEQAVNVGVGPNGESGDLAKLGLRYGAYIKGPVPEDLLVFATGTGSGAIAAGYDVGNINPISQQRANPVDIEFLSTQRYQIKDVNTGTILAERQYDPTQGIHYGGLKVEINATPEKGDRFRIDGNSDGTGNNENMQRIVDLETDRTLIPGAKTLGEAYTDAVGNVGGIAGQARITQKALEVINTQAIETRDSVSGVNLDEEAADLIRYQQAYQAAAKTVQMASQLFDTIIQLR